MAVWEPVNPKDVGGPPAMGGTPTAGFGAMGARRLLIFGGIALIAVGMLFGDIFAVFILHQNGGQTGAALLAAAGQVSARNPAGVEKAFAQIGGLMEDRGTKVDAHVHMSGPGYLALLLALVQPYVALSLGTKKTLAKLFLAGGILLPLGIFLIHYVGLAYSPFAVIGWASVLADSAGALLIVVLVIEAWGLWSYFRSRRAGTVEVAMLSDQSWECRALLSGGTVLVLLGFFHGAWYAGMHLYEHEAREVKILDTMVDSAASSNAAMTTQAGEQYGQLLGEKAVNIAAHSHIIEFGLLAILLSFIQSYVFLSDKWKRRWVNVLLAGSLILPVAVFLEIKYGLIAGGVADVGGLMVIVALIGMAVGVVRYSGHLDAQGAA
jgi:hypothetical protein